MYSRGRGSDVSESAMSCESVGSCRCALAPRGIGRVRCIPAGEFCPHASCDPYVSSLFAVAFVLARRVCAYCGVCQPMCSAYRLVSQSRSDGMGTCARFCLAKWRIPLLADAFNQLEPVLVAEIS